MNGIDRSSIWKNLKQRLGLKAMGCCGALWSRPRTQTITDIIQQQEEEEEDEGDEETHIHIQDHHQNVQQTSGMMNLAMALAAERNLRDGENVGPPKKDAGTVKSLMMLIEETDGGDWKMKKRTSNVGQEAGKLEGNDWMCCVCMERNKGAAFIPCGHTFCRVCSRELWLNRGSCPVCNHSILEILDIF